MSNIPHEVTAHVVVEFARNFLRTLAGKYGGAATLNEIRVMNQVVLCYTKRRDCSVTRLQKATGIPISTISRIVMNLQSKDWLSDRQDPSDGRKRIISLGPRSLDRTTEDISKLIQWINDFRDHGLPT